MDCPLVTVIVPVCNTERYVTQALQSLLAQTYAAVRIVVVDDASSDGTGEILRRLSDPRLQVLWNPKRLGPAGSRNRALDVADSKYVAFHDSDDIADPRRFETQLAAFVRRPDVRLVAARMAIIDEEGQPTGAMWGYTGAESSLAPSMLFANGLSTSTVIAERALVGDERFDASLGIGSDYDMWLRLMDRGAALCLPDVLVQYRSHASNRSHARLDATEACLERILTPRLRRLGIEVSREELRIHRALGACRAEGTREFLAAADAWLQRLDAANVATRMFADAPFRQVLRAHLLQACDAAAMAGWWQGLGRAVVSPVRRRVPVDREVARRVGRLPWRTVRGWVRRRWPRVGPVIRSAVRAVHTAPPL